MSQQLLLKWNDQTENLSKIFVNFLTAETFVDVTLACDGRSIKAHKIVLSACSPYFMSLFLENPCKHPIVIMKDIRYCDLKAIVEFMYRGEVIVSHDDLPAFMNTAETLKVKRLNGITGLSEKLSDFMQHEIIQHNESTPIHIATPIPSSYQCTDTTPLRKRRGESKGARPRKPTKKHSNRNNKKVLPKIKETKSNMARFSGDSLMNAADDNNHLRGNTISYNFESQMPIYSLNNVNTVSKSYPPTSQDFQDEQPTSADENEFEVDPSMLLQQTFSIENVPDQSHNNTASITLPSPVPFSTQSTDMPSLRKRSGERQCLRPRKWTKRYSNHSNDKQVPPEIKETNFSMAGLPGDALMDATHDDNRSNSNPNSYNSESQMPIYSLNNVNTFSKSYQTISQDLWEEQPNSAHKNEFEVDPSKLLQQTFTTENALAKSHNSTDTIKLSSVDSLEISKKFARSADSGNKAFVPVSIPLVCLGFNLQDPEGPEDVQTDISSLDDSRMSPITGTSHGSDGSLLIYMEQSDAASISKQNNFQDDNVLLPHDSEPQIDSCIAAPRRSRRLKLPSCRLRP